MPLYGGFDTRLPQPGADSGAWGKILDNFLNVSIFNDPADTTNTNGLNGNLKSSAVQTAGAVMTVASKSPTSGNVALAASDLTNGTTGSTSVVLATSPVLTTPNLGTPSALTLTNATGLPIAGLTASTSTAIGVGSVELGNASDTTLSRSAGGQLAVEGVDVLTTSNTKTVTNKAITPRTVALTDASSITINSDNADMATLTLTATGHTLAADSGSPADGQKMLLRVTQPSSSAPYTLSFTTGSSKSYAFGTDIPSITLSSTNSAVDYIGMIYSSAASRWHIVAFIKGF